VTALRQRFPQVLLRGLWLAVLLFPFAPMVLQRVTANMPLWHLPGRWGWVMAYVMLILMAWPIFQQATTRGQTLWLWCMGSAVLLLYNLTADGGAASGVALVAYVAVGLGVLASDPGCATGPGSTPAAVLVPVSLLIGLMAAGAASSAWSGFRLPAHPISLPRGGAAPRFPSGGAANYSRAPDPLARISMSQPVSLSATPVLTIAGAPAATYWAMATYDNFDGRAWIAPADGWQAVTPEADQPLLPPAVTDFPTREWQVTVHRLKADNLPLVYTGVPLAFAAPAGGVDSAPAVTVRPGLRALWAPGATDYTLRLRVPEVDPTALQQAAAAPPPAELEQDLAVPPDLSPEVAALARTIAGDAATPGQAVQGVAEYLRTHETYTTQFSLPAGDVVSAFLLNSHQGYCDQFSTSFIVLMRTLGIPARWVMGYKVGSHDLESNQYVVRARNAHSWAEVYITPYGWIPVDPTPGGDVFRSYTAAGAPPSQPAGPPGTPGAPQLPAPGSPTAPIRSPLAPSLWAFAVIGLAVLAVAGLSALWLRRRGRVLAQRRTESLWRDLARLAENEAESLAVAPMTPRELLALVPAAQQEGVIPVVRLLERAWYGEETLPAAEIATAEATLRSTGLIRR
jgi:transglutaminase-like putative cysteine protease